MVTALPLRRLVFSPRRGAPSPLRFPMSLNHPPGYWRSACVNVNNRFNALSKSNAVMKLRISLACLALAACPLAAAAEDGYDLWLRYGADPSAYPVPTIPVTEIVTDSSSATLAAAGSELKSGLS